MYAKINGTRIYFDVEGMGSVPDGPIMRQKPVCFVLHGGPGATHADYKPSLTPLAERMQLVYIDNRGSGFSDEGPQSTYTLENNVEDVEALRQYLGLDKIVILGQSYGGMVAQTYAVKYQEHLEGLILITTSPSYRCFDRAKQILKERGTEEQKKIAEKIFTGSIESNEEFIKFFDVMEPLYFHSYNPNPTEAEMKAKENAIKRTKFSYQAANEGTGGFLQQYDVIDKLPSVQVPALIIAGRHDWITPVQDSLEIAENLPDNELVIFEHSSHMVIEDEYDLFLSTVTGFVERRLTGRK